MAEEAHPVRKTTLLAVQAVMNDMQRALGEVAKAALEDGEAPEGFTLNLDRKLWVRKTPDAPAPPDALE